MRGRTRPRRRARRRRVRCPGPTDWSPGGRAPRAGGPHRSRPRRPRGPAAPARGPLPRTPTPRGTRGRPL
ncbi:hypothetical protein BRC67_07780 [Halobacteriales archaeon QH_3_68_24]|nr:MAG: hypothetical protein BRC67_07780 [Halobacteriales archaeon QH_3_68_24]PSP52743.1 MAG: hypothetical protein BRC74_05880 [Halobacteriales archaeon QH_7_68_42]PSP69691.1 MAG: hypothetical protein BRC70_06550 [Halobacteriales archaeon QH_6_68_27]